MPDECRDGNHEDGGEPEGKGYQRLRAEHGFGEYTKRLSALQQYA